MSQAEAIYALWLRELMVFRREKSRVITSIFNPILWIFVFGGGLGSSVNIGGLNYQVFVYPGILAMTVLFTSVFYGVYIVWDRRIDILKEVLVAPLSRTTIFVGKVLGGCTDAMLQAFIVLLPKLRTRSSSLSSELSTSLADSLPARSESCQHRPDNRIADGKPRGIQHDCQLPRFPTFLL